jgi:hypothetical protein
VPNTLRRVWHPLDLAAPDPAPSRGST